MARPRWTAELFAVIHRNGKLLFKRFVTMPETNGEIEGIAFQIESKVRRCPNQVTIYNTIHMNLKARLAHEFIGRWGGVAGTDGGEDSQGRAKLRLQTPEQLVSRAVECADLAFDEFRRLGWLLDTPVPTPETTDKDES